MSPSDVFVGKCTIVRLSGSSRNADPRPVGFLPNSLGPVIVQETLDAGAAMLLTATLSFLGLGMRAPAAEWGAMVNGGRVYLIDQWWCATSPGAAIFLTAVGFNLLGDGLRDRLDPRSGAGTGSGGDVKAA